MVEYGNGSVKAILYALAGNESIGHVHLARLAYPKPIRNR